MTAPTFVQEAETAWNSGSAKTTGSFTVQTDDILVAFGILESHVQGLTISNSGTAFTWTERQQVNVTDYTRVYIWTAPATTGQSMTVTFTESGADTGAHYGGNVLTFRDSDGVGASSKTNVSSGAPTLNITTTQADSAIVVTSGDWNATDGGSRTWRTNAGALTEQTYYRDSTRYALYGGYHANAGSVNTYAVGLSAPGSQKYSIAAVEIKGVAGGTLYTTTVAGTVTPAGLTVKQINKIVAGAINPAGLLVKIVSKIVAGSVTPVGVLIKQVNKVLQGTLTAVGTIVTAVIKAVSLAGTVTPVGSIVNQINKVLDGTVTPVGTLVKQVNKVLDAALSLVGSVSSVFISGGGALYEVTVNGALAISGTIVKQVNKIVSGVVTPVGDIVNAARFSVILEGVLTVTGNLVQQVNKVLSGQLPVNGVLVKTANKVLIGVITPTGQLVKTVVKVIGGAISAVGTVTVNYIQQVTVSGTLTAVGTLVSDFINGSGVVLKSMLPWVRRRDRGRGK